MNFSVDLLQSFQPITLQEMDSVALMNRVDTKFTFRSEKLSEILNIINKDYRVLEIDGIRCSRYETLYFDTSDFGLYIQHHNGKLNRYKVRTRIYTDSDLCFFEVKFKNNKGRTIKKRVRIDKFEEKITGNSEKLLRDKSPLLPETLVPALWVNYSRITLVNKHSAERVTIDTGLTYKCMTKEKAYHGLIIAEVKQDSCCKSSFISAMKEQRIKNISISKYCFGVISLFDHVKKNNFKRKLSKINKLML